MFKPIISLISCNRIGLEELHRAENRECDSWLWRGRMSLACVLNVGVVVVSGLPLLSAGRAWFCVIPVASVRVRRSVIYR